MSLILRVDVDKPYGKHNLLRAVASKLKEDYVPNIPFKIGYLSHLKEFIAYCDKNNVQGHFYYRLCTTPDNETVQMHQKSGHVAGLHLENSRSKENLKAELETLQKRVSNLTISTFSKHGSGTYKLGKYHYPKYEPLKYTEWSKELGIKYPSGNGTAKTATDLYAIDGYHENLFWLEPDYRDPAFNTLKQVVEAAKSSNVVVLIHPSNYVADPKTKQDFHQLVQLAKEENINWELF